MKLSSWCAGLCLCLAACGEEVEAPGAVTLQLERSGGATFTATNGADSYTVALSSASLNVVGANLVDAEGKETATFLGERLLDLSSDAPLVLGEVEVSPAAFTEIHVFPGDATAGALLGLTVRLDAVVTLTDGTSVNATLAHAVGAGLAEQEIEAPIAVQSGDERLVTLSFDPAVWLGGIDFDGVVRGGAIDLRAGTGDPAIEAAVSASEVNLFRSFALVEVE
jgi:hypothetical protein